MKRANYTGRIDRLRDRIGDINLLAEHFLQGVVEDSGKQVHGFSEEALAALQRYHWPGNVRELQNVVERAVLLGKGEVVRAEDLPGQMSAGSAVNLVSATGQRLKDALGAPERQIILDALQANNWNRNATAAALGINRTTLYKKMKKLGWNAK